MVALLSEQLGIALAPRRVAVADGARVELDAATEDHSVLVEAWAHQGPAKSAQRNKVLTDAFELIFTAKAIGRPDARLILLFSDEEATGRFRTGWAKAALDSHGIEIVVVELSPETRRSIRDAQETQYR